MLMLSVSLLAWHGAAAAQPFDPLAEKTLLTRTVKLHTILLKCCVCCLLLCLRSRTEAQVARSRFRVSPATTSVRASIGI
jgi:hypothetical protein